MALPENDYANIPREKPKTPFKKEEKGSDRATAFGNQVLPGGADEVARPGNYYRKWRHGKNIPYWAMAQVRHGSERLGYNEDRDRTRENAADKTVDLREGEAPTTGTLSSWAAGQGGPGAYHMDEAPTVGRLSAYVNERLGVGLTPEQEAAIRGRSRDVVESSAATMSRQQGNRLAAAGMDPRSGVANARAAAIGNDRARGLADVEREITLQDLARIRDIEGLGTNVGQLEESQRTANMGQDLATARLEEAGRQFNVGSTEGRRRFGDSLQAGLTDLGERQREFDIDYTESAKQARRARTAWRAAANALKPTTLEYIRGIAGSLNQGVDDGGGGGV